MREVESVRRESVEDEEEKRAGGGEGGDAEKERVRDVEGVRGEENGE